MANSNPIPNQRNGQVTVRDFSGNTVSTFFQYGFIDWRLFHSCLTVVVSTSNWAVFKYDEKAGGKYGTAYPAGDELVDPGDYILLGTDGNPITVELTELTARTRHPTAPNSPILEQQEDYHTRTRARDPCCLVSGLPFKGGNSTRFSEAHIYPHAYDDEWVNKGYPNLITDPAPIHVVGGPTKIDSIQNVFLLRRDIHNAWDSYEFTVNPDAGYIVIPFIAGYEDIAGKTLKLDHIADPAIRPLDELFRDHFLQCILANMKGEGEPPWDYEVAFGDGVDLSSDLWSGKEGRAHLQFELGHRLHELRSRRLMRLSEAK